MLAQTNAVDRQWNIVIAVASSQASCRVRGCIRLDFSDSMAQRRFTTDKATSARMSAVRSFGTAPELIVRQLLSARGVRYRLHRQDLPGRPDIFVPRLQLALFINGCFWHDHDCVAGSRRPKRNRHLWQIKLSQNVSRDKRNREELKMRGIRVVVIWTCQIEKAETLSDKIASEYERIRQPTDPPTRRVRRQ